MNVPDDERRYIARLVERLGWTLQERLIAVYALGGLAFDDYRPGKSDLDIYVIVSSSLNEHEKHSIADRCRHRSLPCPAPRLELVVISARAARHPGPAPRWELNLNTGPSLSDHVGLDPAAEPAHWFVLDLAIARERGATLLGPAPREVIGAPRTADVRAAQSEAVAWYAENDMPAEAVAAACRAWHWLATGRFASKRQAARWALAETYTPAGLVTPGPA
jgi:hypothetical protein